MAQNSNSLVLLGVAENELEANVWRDILAQESIRVLVKEANPLASIGLAPRLGARKKMFVRAEDEKRARWLLGDHVVAE